MWTSLCVGVVVVWQEVVEEAVSEPEVKAEPVAPTVVKQEAGAAKTEASKTVEPTVTKVRLNTRRHRGEGEWRGRGHRGRRADQARWPLGPAACHVRRLDATRLF